MKTPKHPIRLHSSPTTGVQHSSLGVVGDLIPHKAMGTAALNLSYNIQNHNICALDVAATFNHTSGPVSLGYSYNSISPTPWQIMVAGLVKMPPSSPKNGDQALLRTIDGAIIPYVFSDGVFYESDYASSRNTLAYNAQSKVWVLYNPKTQQRNIFNTKGQLISKYKDALDRCEYEYDSTDRLIKITPPGEAKEGRYYQVAYAPNKAGELVSFALNTKTQSTVLRQYQLDDTGFLQTTYVCNTVCTAALHTLASTDYQVQYTYQKIGKNLTALQTIKQSDGSQLSFNFPSDSLALNEILIGSRQVYAITCNNSALKTGQFSFEVSEGTKQTIHFDLATTAITQVSTLLLDPSAPGSATHETSTYVYDSNRLSKQTDPNGLMTQWTRESDPKSVSYGMPTYMTKGALKTQYSYSETNGRVFPIEIIRTIENSKTLTDTFIPQKPVARPGYDFDHYTTVAYHITPANRVTKFMTDPISGLPEFTQAFDTPLTAARTLTELDTWASAELKALRFSLTRTEYREGTTLPSIQSSYLAVKPNGEGDDTPNTHSLIAHTYNDLFQCTSVENVKEHRPTQNVSQITNKTYNELGQTTAQSQNDITIYEPDFWQKQVVDAGPVERKTHATYQNTPDGTGCLHALHTLPNARTDEHLFSEHAWLMATVSTDPVSGATRTNTNAYGLSGRLWKQTTVTGQESFHYYDDMGRPTYLVDACGGVTKHGYHTAKHYTTVTHYSQPIDVTKLTIPASLLVQSQLKKNPALDKTNIEFHDEYGNLKFSIDEERYVVEHRYNDQQLKTSTIRYMTAITEAVLSAWLSGKTAPNMAGPTDDTPITKDTQSSYLIDTHYYNDDSLMILSIDPDGWATANTPDAHKNQIRQIQLAARYTGPRPQTTLPKLAYNPELDVYSFSFYDRRQRKIMDVDAKGYVSEYKHDLSNDVVSETHYATPVDINALIHSTTHQAPALPASDPEDKIIVRLHDYSGHEIRTDAASGLSSFKVIDSMRNVATHVSYDRKDPASLRGDSLHSQHKIHNCWNQVTAENTPWTEPLLQQILTRTDVTPAQRHALVMTHWQEKSRRNEYTESGLLAKQFNALNTSTEKNVGATLFFRDKMDRVVLTVAPEGQVAEQEFNGFGLLTGQRKLEAAMDTTQAPFQSLSGGTLTAATSATIASMRNAQLDAYTETQYDLRGNKALSIDPEGYQSSWAHDALKRCTENRRSKMAKDSLDIIHATEFDGRNNEVSKVTANTQDSLQVKSSASYDHPINLKTSSVDSRGKETTITRDVRGCSTAETHSGPNAKTDTKTYTHDAFLRMLTSTNGLKQTVTHQYSQEKRTHTIVSPGGQIAQLKTHNVFGKKISLQKSTLTPITWEHDGAGKLTEQTNPRGLSKTLNRNFEGRLLSRLNEDGTQDTWAVDGSGRVTQHIEDATGRALTTHQVHNGLNQTTETTNPRGIVTENTFDKRSLLIQSVLDPKPSDAADDNTTPHLQRCTKTSYEGLRNRTLHEESSLPSFIEGTPNNRFSVAFDSDTLGRATSKSTAPETLNLTQENKLDPTGKVSCNINKAGEASYFFRNILGQLAFTIDNGGFVTHKQYDPLNRVSVISQYPYPLDLNVLEQLNPEMTLSDFEAILGDALTTQIPTEERPLYDINSRIVFVVKVLRDTTSTIKASITSNIRDDAGRLVQKVQYANYLSWTTEPTWSTDYVAAQLKTLQSPRDCSTYFILDDMGNARYIIKPNRQITEKKFSANGKVWLTVHYENQLPSGTVPSSLTLASMSKAVAVLANPMLDHIKGTFLNNHGKIAYAFESANTNQVELKYFERDAADNITMLCRFSALITITSLDCQTILKQCQAVKPDRAIDRIWEKTYTADNQVSACIDEVGNTDAYAYNDLGLLVSHTDRAGALWTFAYDEARRRTQKVSPEVDVYATQEGKDADGNLTLLPPVLTRRSIVEVTQYNQLSQVTKKIKDFGEGPGFRNDTAQISYDSHGKPQSNWQDGVFLDDSTNTEPTAAELPVQKTPSTVIRSSFKNAFEQVTLTQAQGAPLKCFIYDSMKRKQFQIIITQYDDTSWQAGITEYRYNALNQRTVTIAYATPLAGKTPWNSKWFKEISILDITELGSVKTSTDDRISYRVCNKQGLPVRTYKGLDGEKSDFEKGDLFGIVPYYDSYTGQSGVGYSLEDNFYSSQGKILRESTPMDANNKFWSDIYRWYDTSGKLLAEATPQQASFKAKTQYVIARKQYNTYHDKVSELELATPYTDEMSLDTTLEEIDNFIAANKSPKDRITQYSYDQRGFEITETKVNVSRSYLKTDPSKAVPTVCDATTNLVKTTAYSTTGQTRSETHSALTSTGTVELSTHTYRDDAGRVVAQVGLPVGDAKSYLYPLTTYQLDGHDNAIAVRNYVNGADPSTLTKAIPAPLSADDANDPVELSRLDTLSHQDIHVDAEGHPTLYTYAANSKGVRQLQAVKQLAAKDLPEQTVIDEKRKVFDHQCRLSTQSVCRDGKVIEMTALKHNVFGEKVAEGASLDSLVLKSKNDQLGNERISSEAQDHGRRGVGIVTQRNLRGKPTQYIKSAEKDLMQLAIADLPTLDSLDSIEVTTLIRGPGKGTVVKEIHPTTTIGYSRLTTRLQIELATQIFSSQYDSEVLQPRWSWPKAGINNSTLQLTITLADGTVKPYPVVDLPQANRWVVDVSDLPTGEHAYHMNYITIDAATKEHRTLYEASGSAPVVSAVAATEPVVIPYVRDDAYMGFAGELSDYTHAIITDTTGAVVATLALTDVAGIGHKRADCTALTSGYYHSQLTDGAAKQSSISGPMTINTITPPHEVLSWEIPCALSIGIENDKDPTNPQPKVGHVSCWDALPPSLRKSKVTLNIAYTNTAGEEQTLMLEDVEPGADSTALINFDYAVKSIDSVDMSCRLDPQNLIPLYSAENPTEASGSSFTLTPRTFIYCRGDIFKDSPEDISIKLKDVSQDLGARWTNMEGSGIPGGAVFDITGFNPGHYPITKETGDIRDPIGSLDILKGGKANASNSSIKRHLKAVESKPEQFYTLDAFDNHLEKTDSDGVVRYEYNDLNKTMSVTTPPVNTYEPDSAVLVQKSGTTFQHFDSFGNNIATTHPMGNQDTYTRDPSGHPLMIQDGVGIPLIQNNLDALGRTKSYVRYGYTTKLVHTLNGQVAKLLLPNTDPAINNGGPIVVSKTYDAHQNLTSLTNGCNETSVYRFDANDNVSDYISPMGHRSSTQWFCGAKISEQRPNGLTQTWCARVSPKQALYKYLGMTDSNTDLGNSVTQTDYDYKLQRTRAYGISIGKDKDGNSTRGNFIRITPYYKKGTEARFRFTYYDKQPLQDQSFFWSAGKLMRVDDKATNMQTRHDYDEKNRPIYTCFSRCFENATDDSIIHESWSGYDALERETISIDNELTQQRFFDLNSNTLRALAARNGEKAQSFWNLFDKADRMTLSHGIFDTTTNTIKVSSAQGVEVTYDSNGLRSKETVFNKVYTDYTHHPSGALATVTPEAATGNDRLAYIYDAARRLKIINKNDKPSTANEYDLDDCLLKQTTDGNITDYIRDACGTILSQVNTLHKGGSYTLSYSYRCFGSNTPIASVAGSTHNSNGSTFASSYMTYDPNGDLRTKDGAADMTGQQYSHRTCLVTDPQHRVRQKFFIPGTFSENNDSSNNYLTRVSDYGYTASDTYMGCHTYDYGELGKHAEMLIGKHLSRAGESGQSEVLPAAIARMSTLAHDDIQQQTADVHRDFHNLAEIEWLFAECTAFPMIAIVIMGARAPRHMSPAGRRAYKLKIANKQGYSRASHGNPDFDHQILQDFTRCLKDSGAVGQETSYVAVKGDTYKTIAQALTGDQSNALAIALANDASTEDDAITPGVRLRIPSFVSPHNTAFTHTPSSELMNLMIGAMTPHLIFAQAKPKKHHWWEFLIPIVIAIIVSIVTAGAGAAVAGALGINATLASAFVAAATDAALQGLAKATGLIEHFNFTEVLMAGIGAGISELQSVKDIMDGVQHLNLICILKEAGVVAAKNLTEQLSELALGHIKHINLKQIINSLVSYAVNTVIDAKIPSNGSNATVFTKLENNLLTAEADALTGKVITGSEYDFFATLGRSAAQFPLNLLQEKALATIKNTKKKHAKPSETKNGLTCPGGGLPGNHGVNQRDTDGHVHGYDDGEMRHTDSDAQAKRAEDNITQVHDQSEEDQLHNQMQGLHKQSIFNCSEQSSQMPGFDWEDGARLAAFSGDSPSQDAPEHELAGQHKAAGSDLPHEIHSGHPSSIAPVGSAQHQESHPYLDSTLIGLEKLTEKAFGSAMKLAPTLPTRLYLGGKGALIGGTIEFLRQKNSGIDNITALKETAATFLGDKIVSSFIADSIAGPVGWVMFGVQVADVFIASQIPAQKARLAEDITTTPEKLAKKSSLSYWERASLLRAIYQSRQTDGQALAVMNIIHSIATSGNKAGHKIMEGAQVLEQKIGPYESARIKPSYFVDPLGSSRAMASNDGMNRRQDKSIDTIIHQKVQAHHTKHH